MKLQSFHQHADGMQVCLSVTTHIKAQRKLNNPDLHQVQCFFFQRLKKNNKTKQNKTKKHTRTARSFFFFAKAQAHFHHIMKPRPARRAITFHKRLTKNEGCRGEK